MNKFRGFLLSTFGFTKSFTGKGKQFKSDMTASLLRVKEALAEENDETRKMLEVYYRFSLGQATDKEMEEANDQFRSMLKTIGLGVLAVLPFSPLTIPLLVKIGKYLGIDILPNSFKNHDEPKA